MDFRHLTSGCVSRVRALVLSGIDCQERLEIAGRKVDLQRKTALLT